MSRVVFKNQAKKKKKVLVALSGGIDSAVSAYLLIKAGYEVEGVFMKNWSSTTGLKYDECPWLQDRQDALRVAAFLRIPLHTVDFEKDYKQNVLNYFFEEYRAGRTPNPDVMCNKEIKFKLLYDWAIKKHKFDYLATGHYAQVRQSKQGGFELVRSKDEFKDQTYFIYNIKKDNLPKEKFPVGGMKKSNVKELAQKLNLPNANKKESMGLCFVGRIRLKDFLEQKLKPKSGPILDMNGKKIGKHEGLHYYTIGQRQGIKVGAGGPYFVAQKDSERNILVVTNNPNDRVLEVKELQIHSVNWISEPKKFPTKLVGRFRHQGKLEGLTITKINHSQISKKNVNEVYTVVFHKPQRAVASGQSLVLYNKKICVGGGVIV